jgi:hypothetical protein
VAVDAVHISRGGKHMPLVEEWMVSVIFQVKATVMENAWV